MEGRRAAASNAVAIAAVEVEFFVAAAAGGSSELGIAEIAAVEAEELLAFANEMQTKTVGPLHCWAYRAQFLLPSSELKAAAVAVAVVAVVAAAAAVGAAAAAVDGGVAAAAAAVL